MDWWLVFAVLLYLMAAALIIAEVFVPSGGIISIFALACLIGGGFIFFDHGPAIGWVGVGLAVVMIPTVLWAAYKAFPYTGFGKSVTLEPPERQPGDAIPDTPRLKELLGKTAKVISDLRPVGMCDFDGRRVECVADTNYIEKGSTVKVIRVEGTQLTVRLVEETNA